MCVCEFIWASVKRFWKIDFGDLHLKEIITFVSIPHRTLNMNNSSIYRLPKVDSFITVHCLEFVSLYKRRIMFANVATSYVGLSIKVKHNNDQMPYDQVTYVGTFVFPTQ